MLLSTKASKANLPKLIFHDSHGSRRGDNLVILPARRARNQSMAYAKDVGFMRNYHAKEKLIKDIHKYHISFYFTFKFRLFN